MSESSTSVTHAAYIGLVNPKNPINVGAVMRAAGCYQADGVYYTGERFARAARYQTDTKDIKNKIPLLQADHFRENLPAGMEVICVEFAEGATALPDFVHPDRALYIFGPEDGSISQELINAADYVVYVPTIGCMNLAASVNVVLYDRMCKSAVYFPGAEAAHDDTWIKHSRDTNNRLTMKTKTAT